MDTISSQYIVVLELYSPISRKTRKKSFEKNAIEVWNREWDKSWDIAMKWIYIMIRALKSSYITFHSDIGKYSESRGANDIHL
jgi:hypothetical protein